MLRVVIFCVFIAVIAAQMITDNSYCDLIKAQDCTQFPDFVECGTNGVTYPNRCVFSKAHCDDINIHIAHSGQCTGASGGGHEHLGHDAVAAYFCKHLAMEQCSVTNDYLCASDGKTYQNICEFEKSSCMHEGLHIKYFTPCLN